MFLFIHHCDLRISDNTTINYLIKNNKPFIPIFIGTPDQLEPNVYKSSNSIRFMVQSLEELSAEYKSTGLSIFYGETAVVLEELIKNNTWVKGVANNIDYSPYAMKRDKSVSDLCLKYNIEYIAFEDKLLNEVESIKTGAGKDYSKYTPYFNNANQVLVPQPIDFSKKVIGINNRKLKQSKFDSNLEYILGKAKDGLSPEVKILGGRSHGIKILQSLDNFGNYNDERNIPIIPTTRLSAYLKFGCISPREAFYAVSHKLGIESELIKQLYWRDFYSMILYNYGTDETPVSITKPHFLNIQWQENPENLQRWKDGMTGCPIVDAGMREMNTTGFMHNRLRMIVASFLIFFLKIDWREGMRYFSQKLVDIDWANNVGNWQWTAGVEKWSNDYYRVFSMESQTTRFDPECEYIKFWVPELASVPAKNIINWDTDHTKYPSIKYPKPIISNNKEARQNGISMYKDAI